MLLLLSLFSLAHAEPDPAAAFDWNHINWDAIRTSAETTCDEAIRSRHDMLQVIALQQELGNTVARELLRMANVELPLASGALIGGILVRASDDDVHQLGAAFSEAERAYADEAARIAARTSALEADKPKYQSERPVGGRARRRLVAECVTRVVDAFRWGDEGMRLNARQVAFLRGQYDEVVARIETREPRVPTISVEPILDPEPRPAEPAAAPPAPTSAERPAPRVGPTP